MEDSNKPKFLYLTGAGASANSNSLPVAANLPQQLHQLSNELNSIFPPSDPNLIDELKKNLFWLHKVGKENQTIDQYARDCFIKGHDDDLNRLKETLIIFFIIEQYYHKKRDIRYRNFIQKVIDKQRLFPNYIRILTWNYDYQFQLAANEYHTESFIKTNAHSSVSSEPLIGYFPPIGFKMSPNSNKTNISLIHINGIAGLFDNAEVRESIYLENHDPIQLLQKFYKRKKDFLKHFHFAWEGSFNLKSSNINIMVEDVEYLVIIGYSFPDFNFKFDNYIFNELKPSLKKIYFQELNKEVKPEKLRNLFDISDNIEIVMDYDCTEFLLPKELKKALFQ